MNTNKNTIISCYKYLADILLQITVFIPYLMRMKSEFQSRITSLERMMEYACDLPAEAAREVAGGDKEGREDWPATGAVEFR